MVAAAERLHADVVGFLAVALLHTVWRLTKDQSGECGAAASQLQPAAMGALRWAGRRRAERQTHGMPAQVQCRCGSPAEPTLPGRVDRARCMLPAGWQSGIWGFTNEKSLRCGLHYSRQRPLQASLCCAACVLQGHSARQSVDAQQLYWCLPDAVQRTVEGLTMSLDMCHLPCRV